ncbi:MAG: ATPase, T2SS/T4P/T4SS family, partial [Gemmatimonadota bacterium]
RMATMIGQLLVDEGATSAAEVEAALLEQRETRERLGEILVRRGLDPEVVARALATQLRLGYAAPPLAPAPDAVGLLARDHALRLRVVPLEVEGRSLRVATADPLDAGAIDDLQFRVGRRAEPLVATPTTVERGLATAYGEEAVRAVLERLRGPGPGGGRGAGAGRGSRAKGPSPSAGTAGAPGAGPGAPVAGEESGDPGEAEILREASEAPPIVALLNLVLERALAAGASDVHVEPTAEVLRVRARVDGVLRPVLEAPATAAAAVISRIKITAGLDIAVKRRPQDGRTAVRVSGKRVDVRVSTLPSQDGEKAVLRLLDPGGGLRSLDRIGMEPGLRAELEATVTREHGLVLVTGPTGSGKTTTLYALLAARDRDGRNIVTLEDPVEYRLGGVTQVQVQPRAGLTFAAALRSVLRQDPDVVMVGELRDAETAETGLAAALTGHLVLSTLHTNDAPGAVGRLVEMGAARYLVAGGLAGVLAQRLVRRLCDRCRTVEPAAGGRLYDLGLPTPPHLPKAVGCERCDGTGYRGRVGILATDAWAKVEQGLTTLDEVRPLLALLADEARTCGACGGRVAREQRYCPHCGGEVVRQCGCGATLRPHWRFCGRCGNGIESAGPGGRPRLPAPP